MLFKSKQSEHAAPPVVRGPLRQTLDAHLARMESINKERRTLAERAGTLLDDIERADRSAKEVQALQHKIDAQAVTAVVEGTIPADLTAERAELARLEQRHAILAQRAEVARKARTELQTKSETLLRDEYRPLQPAINHLLLDALREDMNAFANELRAAENTYRAVLRRVFLRATAIDLLSTQNRLGVFCDSMRYTQHAPQLPIGAPFDTLCPNRFDANADYVALQAEAEALIGKLLCGGADDDAA
jgi:hypothetical protein